MNQIWTNNKTTLKYNSCWHGAFNVAAAAATKFQVEGHCHSGRLRWRKERSPSNFPQRLLKTDEVDNPYYPLRPLLTSKAFNAIFVSNTASNFSAVTHSKRPLFSNVLLLLEETVFGPQQPSRVELELEAPLCSTTQNVTSTAATVNVLRGGRGDLKFLFCF